MDFMKKFYPARINNHPFKKSQLYIKCDKTDKTEEYER